ncbi:hypothetical protein [Streptomyces sp. NPDC002788]
MEHSTPSAENESATETNGLPSRRIQDNSRLHTRGQWIEAEIVAVREETDGDGNPRFYAEAAFTPPDVTGPRPGS